MLRRLVASMLRVPGGVPAARFLSRILPDLQASGGVAQVARATVS